jgi:hypothetical protein
VTPLFSDLNLIGFYCFLCSADEVAMEVSKAAQRQTAPQDSTGADEQKPEHGGAVVLTREGTTAPANTHCCGLLISMTCFVEHSIATSSAVHACGQTQSCLSFAWVLDDRVMTDVHLSMCADGKKCCFDRQ